MVGHSNAVAMIELYYAISGAQAPWRWPEWGTRTELRGLFGPEPDAIPTAWTKDDVAAVKTFFEAYHAKATVEAKLSFASAKTGDDYRGRVLWKDFIQKNWKAWKVQSSIFAVFEAKSILYTQTMIANDMDEVPDSIPFTDAFDDIAFSLFGPESLDANGKVKYALRKPVSTLAVNASTNLRKVTRSLVKRLANHKEQIDSLLDVLSTAGATMDSVKELALLVTAWKKDIKFLPSTKNLEALGDVEGELAGIMVSLGGTMEVADIDSVKKGRKAIRKNAKALAKKEEGAAGEALALLVNHFAADEDIPELYPLIDIDFGGLEEGLDPGVSFESRKLFEEVEELKSAHPDAGSFAPVAFHPHQIQGAHAALRQFFTPEPSPENGCGVLIADAPGLGKTAMALGIIGFIISVGIRQDARLSLPPLINVRPFLGTRTTVPNLPTIIVAPGTLTGQWRQEHHVFIKPDIVAVFNYPTSKPARTKFFAQGGPYNSCTLPPRNRVIIVTQSTLFTEYRDLYQQPGEKEKRDFPWSIPKKKLNYDARVGSTLFGRDYLCGVIDEAHFCRNPGATHWGPLALLQQCATRLVLTATPVQTRIEDIGAMGRLANVAHFFTQAFADEIATDAAEIRRARLSGLPSVPLLQGKASRRMQMQFNGAMICRSVDSKDFHGRPLLVLPRKDVYRVHLQLQPWELEHVDQSLTEECFEQMALAKIQGIQTESLYSNERLMVTFPREDRKQPIPSIQSARQWEDAREPTKLTEVKNLAKYLLSGDDAPAPIVGETGIVYPHYVPSKATTRVRKILIYQEFPIYMELLREVLGVFGVFALALNGALNYPARERVVKEFIASTKYRTLIISKVGAVGLNLTVANILIFLDQQWSYADENQAIGRIYRQGQTLPVSIFHVLAAGTVDYYMSRLAQGKGLLSKAFLTTERQNKLASILMGGDAGLGESNVEEGAKQSAKKRKEVKETKEARKARKAHEAKEAKELEEAKKAKEAKEAKKARKAQEVQEAKELEEAKKAKEAKEAKKAKEAKEAKKARKAKEAKEAKELEEAKEAKKARTEKKARKAKDAEEKEEEAREEKRARKEKKKANSRYGGGDEGSDHPPAAKPQPKPKKKVTSLEFVEDSEPERSLKSKRAPNRKPNFDTTDEDELMPFEPAGGDDFEMGFESDSEGGISLGNVLPPSSRASSRLHTETNSNVSMVSYPGRRGPASQAPSGGSSSSDDDLQPLASKKRERSDSVQQVALAAHAAAAPPKRLNRRPSHSLSTAAAISFERDEEDHSQLPGGVFGRDDFANENDFFDGHTPDEPPFTQRPSSYASKSASSSQIGELAAQELVRRRLAGGSNPHIRTKDSAHPSDSPGEGSRKSRSGLSKITTSQSRPTIPLLGNPYAKKGSKNPFARK